MLYDLNWLISSAEFPPKIECCRLQSYEAYKTLFDMNPWEDFTSWGSRLIANFDEYFRPQLWLGYQRLSTIKLADMVVGTPPTISVANDDMSTDKIKDILDRTDFYEKLYQMVIDFSRYGATVTRLFDDDLIPDEPAAQFAVWDPAEWFLILRKDGTKRVKDHLLVWRVNYGTPSNPVWMLKVQQHPVEGGYFIERTYSMGANGETVDRELTSKTVQTGDMPCLVIPAINLASTSNPYGTSDYRIIDGLVQKATERLKHILDILDAHSDPSMTGPATMLVRDDITGELVFKKDKFYAVSPGEEHPEYLTWDGKLDSAFEGLKELLNQIYIMSEMGEAFLGNTQGVGNAISGTAMRYKMISPLEKARRVANSLTLPVKKLVAGLIQIETGKKIRFQDISVTWGDSLPRDPREMAELTRLQTGAPQIMPLKHALIENYGLGNSEAEHYIEEIRNNQEMWAQLNQTDSGTGNARPGEAGNPAAPPNPARRGSKDTPTNTGTKNTNNSNEDGK